MYAITFGISASIVHHSDLDVHLHLGKYVSILSEIRKPLFSLQYQQFLLRFEHSLLYQIRTDSDFLQQNKNNTAKKDVQYALIFFLVLSYLKISARFKVRVLLFPAAEICMLRKGFNLRVRMIC